MISRVGSISWEVISGPYPDFLNVYTLDFEPNTVNVDIFASINFRRFTKMRIFVWIRIRALRINGSLGYHKSNFHSVHIFADIQETRTTRKYVQREGLLSEEVGAYLETNTP